MWQVATWILDTLMDYWVSFFSLEKGPCNQIQFQTSFINIYKIIFLEHNRVSRFVFLLEEMLRDCPTNQESLLSTNGVAVIGALLVNVSLDSRKTK